jgi:hypothetical protein
LRFIPAWLSFGHWLLGHTMTKHQKSFHKYSAVSLLCVSVFFFCCMSCVAFHPRSLQDAKDMIGVSAITSLVLTLWWIYCWFTGSVSIRSVTIDRKSEPKTYRLAMLGFLIFDLAFLVSIILNLYVVYKHAA